jgi:hypothetical protein
MRKEVMFLFGIGFRGSVLASFTEGKESLPLSMMRLWFRQVANMFGYGLQFTQFTNLYLVFTFLMKETCL